MEHCSGKKDTRGGQSLIEVLLGIAFLVLSVGTAIMLVFGGEKALIDRDTGISANSIAKEGIGAARMIAERGWDELSEGTHGVSFSDGSWEFEGNSDVTDGIFTRTVTVTEEEEYVKSVESSVSWQTDPLRIQHVEFTTLITDWRNAVPVVDPGDSGGEDPFGDWRNPRTLGSLDLGPGNEATDLDVVNKIVYMSAVASAAAKPDFFIVNAIDGENPFIVSEIDTGKGLNGVDASGGYAYVANESENAELQVIDISQIVFPSVVASFKVPGVTGKSKGQSVFYLDGKVYLGLNKSNGPEFNIIDVSNPSDPQLLGSFEVGGNVNDVYVRGTRAYLATDVSGKTLMILDVGDPSSVTLLGQGYADEGMSVFAMNSSLLLFGENETFHTVDASDESSPTTFGSIGAGGAIRDIVARQDIAFLATSNNNQEFQVINITDSANPSFWSSFNFPQVATGIDYENNLVYVSVRSNDALRIITSGP